MTITQLFPDTANKSLAELESDRKQVYNVGIVTLIALADKYGVTTRSLTYARQHPNPVYASLAVQACASKSDTKALQGSVYGEIKRRMAAA